MKMRLDWNRAAQVAVVFGCALGLKLYYSSASANDLRWILGPTTRLVELVSSTTFQYESHAGYISDDRRFLIASSCAGVNFLITALVMLAGRRLVTGRRIGWSFIPAAAVIAYLVTLAANATRIAIALWLQRTGSEIAGLNEEQIHRFEGIFVYFGFLLLLFVAGERFFSGRTARFVARLGFPLVVYYAITLVVPLANGGYSRGSGFWEHSLWVILIPSLLVLTLASIRVLYGNAAEVLRWWRVMVGGRRPLVKKSGVETGCPRASVIGQPGSTP
jgi:exosortase K